MTARPGTTPVAGRTGEEARRGGLVSRRLKVLSVVAPVAFVTAGELLRFALENSPWWSPGLLVGWRVVLYAGFVGCIAAFAALMLATIERAEAGVVRQNADLRTANAVSAAAQGPADPATVVHSATEALARTTGATHVRLTVFAAPGADHPTVEASAGPHEIVTGTPVVDRTLRDDAGPVGHLTAWGAPGRDVADALGESTQAALAHQVVSAVRLARAVEDLHRRRDEGHAFYTILLDISRHAGTLPTLRGIARHTRDLLAADAAAVVLHPATAAGVRFDSDADAPLAGRDGTVTLGAGLHEPNPPAHGGWRSVAQELVTGPGGPLGRLWVGRVDSGGFSDRDRAFLGTMAGLAGIALTSAQVREDARQREVLNERTRIAREMHDSLAQVLGAVHLRLRTLEPAPEVRGQASLASEISALADVCDEAYRDVREVILGLRDSDRTDRGLEHNLRAYLAAYEAQSGVATSFVNELGGELVLAPRTEVHLIRVVQEALTNVRKHARARRATVTVTGTATSTSFEIADDGLGFEPASDLGASEGYGLFTMRDRLSLLGGSLTVTSAPGRGTRVVATVPERPVPAVGVRGAW